MKTYRNTIVLLIFIIVSLFQNMTLKAACCNFAIDLISPTITKMPKGATQTLKYRITSSCTNIHDITQFTFSNLTGVTVTPSSFSLKWNTFIDISVKMNMPATLPSNAVYTFGFKVLANSVPASCSNQRLINIKVKEGSLCTFSLIQNTSPASILQLEKGKSYSYIYTLKNLSSTSTAYNYKKISNITVVTNLPATLSPGASRNIMVTFLMPNNVNNNQKVMFKFQITNGCSAQYDVIFYINALPVCCNYSVSPPATPLKELGIGLSVNISYTVKNFCTDPRAFTTTLIRNVVSITPSTFTVPRGGSQIIQVKITMPETITLNNSLSFSFSVKSNCGDTGKRVDFTVKAIRSCCSFSVTKNSTPAIKQFLTIGSSYTYNYTVKNTCTNAGDNTNFSLLGVSNITTINPTSFTLTPGATKIVSIRFTMPNAPNNTSVEFKFKVIGHCDQTPTIVLFRVKATRNQ